MVKSSYEHVRFLHDAFCTVRKPCASILFWLKIVARLVRWLAIFWSIQRPACINVWAICGAPYTPAIQITVAYLGLKPGIEGCK